MDIIHLGTSRVQDALVKLATCQINKANFHLLSDATLLYIVSKTTKDCLGSFWKASLKIFLEEKNKIKFFIN